MDTRTGGPQVHKIIGQIYAFMNSYKCFTALRQLVQKKKCFKQCSTKAIFVFAGFQTKFFWYEWKMLKVLIWFKKTFDFLFKKIKGVFLLKFRPLQTALVLTFH